jgi:hypothetical protein
MITEEATRVSRIYDAPIDSITLVRGAPASFMSRRQRVTVAEVIDR